MKPIFTLAAISDIHLEKNFLKRDFFSHVNNEANLLIIGGDITSGATADVKLFLELISDVRVPIVLVFGNHDYNAASENEIKKMLLTNPLIKILDGDYVEYEFKGSRLGIAGAMGYGGGFSSEESSDRGIEKLEAAQAKMSQPMPEYIVDLMHWEREKIEVEKLTKALHQMEKAKPKVGIALTHWAAFEEVILGEEPSSYPLFGSSLLGDAILHASPQLALSGHSHHGPQGIKKVGSKVFACNICYKVNEGRLPFFDFFIDGSFSLRYL